MSFCDEVKYVREKLHLSQQMLAKELGIAFSTVNRWEKDNREPQIVSQGKFYAFCERQVIHFEEYGEELK